MSLVSTLAKVAIGVAVAKGVSTLVQGGAAAPSGGGGSRTPGGGSLQDMMGDLLLSLRHLCEPTRPYESAFAVFCLH